MAARWMLNVVFLAVIFDTRVYSFISAFPKHHNSVCKNSNIDRNEFQNYCVSKMETDVDTTPSHDLWVVGAGTLGGEIAKEWKRLWPDSSVVAETLTNASHHDFESFGIIPRLRDDRSSANKYMAKNVVVSIRPSIVNFFDELEESVELWAGPSAGGSLLYTSSTGVYGSELSHVFNELSPVNQTDPRSSYLVRGESVILKHGGAVIRLVGLYNLQKGPHMYWASRVAIDGAPTDMVNLIHYEDAARVSIKAMQHNFGEKSGEEGSSFQPVFVASDGSPVSKYDICSSTKKALFPNKTDSTLFTLKISKSQKICDSNYTMKLLNFEPKYKSLPEFMQSVQISNNVTQNPILP